MIIEQFRPYRLGGGSAEPIGVLTTDGQIFRCDGQPWRWKGVSAFGLLNRFANGEDISGFLSDFAGFNLLRVWPYVTWPGVGWEPPPVATILAFLDRCAAAGFYVELTLLTDDITARLQPAQYLLAALAAAQPSNLLIECANEPLTHKNIDTHALRHALDASGFLYSSGDYEDSSRFFGRYLTCHTGRDEDWPRRAHDLFEYYGGGGPSSPADPAHRCPIIADEPPKPSDVGGNKDQDFLAYFATCSLLGAGATYHCESGKLATRPNDEEKRLAAAALAGLDAFPADAPKGGYRRIDESGRSLRTYAVGPYMVRVRPTIPEAPEAGWHPLEPSGVLWAR